MKTFLYFALILMLSCNNASRNNTDPTEWLLEYEKSGYTKTATYDEVISFCKKLDAFSDQVYYSNFGTSVQGYVLPLLIIDKDGFTDVSEVRKSGKVVLLVEANIHAGEPEGVDAGFMLVRDIIVNKKYENLLDHVTLLFIPSFNVDGHRRFIKYSRINQNGPEMMGWRTTAQNLNLNRDFLKADAVEMKSWLKLFNEWLPDFFIDCHTTDGADYQYALTYGLEIKGNMDADQTNWQKETYLDRITKMMEGAGYPIFPYVAFSRWHDPKSGLRSWISKAMLSTGYVSYQNRPGLLIETHMLKNYENRVSSTYEMIKFTMEILNDQYKELLNINMVADERISSPEFRKTEFPLDYKLSNDSVIVVFRGIEYTEEISDMTNGPWFKYNGSKKDFNLALFNDLKTDKSVKLPDVYIIPTEWTDVIERIKLHGIKFIELEKDTSILIKTYKFKNVRWDQSPYEGRQKIQNFDSEEIETSMLFQRGSILIDMNQRRAKIIALILEPESPDSYFQWGFFNTIFEQKEYSETYVMETMAREMLAKDSILKAEFEKKIKEEPDFADNQWAICNWFYSKTPYWDERINVYPVGKIYH
ncbi:MAG: M14 family metallopeptidase [Bacteroidota bacterium]